jgi:hypothetical protein
MPCADTHRNCLFLAGFRALRLRFETTDVNGDGIVNINDIIAAAQNLDKGPYNPGSAQGFAGASGEDPAAGSEFTPVPEASTLALLGFGAVCLLAYGWRRRKREPHCPKPRPLIFRPGE